MRYDPKVLTAVFRDERRSMLATLIRVIGDIDRAEDGLSAAVLAAADQWPSAGVPDNPRAWLMRTARNRAIDDVRRGGSARRKLEASDSTVLPEWAGAAFYAPPPDEGDEPALRDDLLRLIFTCCHPALAVEAQVALTLRTIGGLTTDEIARAFLVSPETLAQRLVRAKQKIREARIAYRVPDDTELSERLGVVLTVVYLVFNEGYAATSGDALIRSELAAEAVRLGRLLIELMPERPGPRGLLALMLLQDSRRLARVNAEGELVLLSDQDRSLWDATQIREGLLLLDHELSLGAADEYAVQASIAAVHARAVHEGATDWAQIVALYARLFVLNPTPVVMLNHAVAVAMADGPSAGLNLLDQLDRAGVLSGYRPLPAARGDLLRRLGRASEARSAYSLALTLPGSDVEARYLARRLRELEP